MKFINTSVKKIIPPKSPQQEDEESPAGHMPDPESDDDVDTLNQPFDEDEQYSQLEDLENMHIEH